MEHHATTDTAEGRDLQRMALAAPTTWNEEQRTASVVISTDADVGDGVQLVHSKDAIRWPQRPIPAVLDHRRASEYVWGVVESMQLERVDGRNALVGVVRLDGSPAAMEQAEPRLRNGSARFSVGARIYQVGPPAPGTSLDRAIDWEIAELSLVVTGQDSKSVMRGESDQSTIPDSSMSDQTLEQAGGDPAPVIEAAATEVARSVAVQPQPQTADLERTVADLKRERDITRSCAAAKLSAKETQEFIDSGKTHDEVVRGIFEIMYANQSTSNAGHPVAAPVVTRDAGDTLMRGIGDALMSRIAPGSEVTDLGRQYRGYTLLEYARMLLESRGVDTRGISKSELVQRGFHSTSDFPLLFSNLASKSLDAAYQEEPHTWKPLARQQNLPDFKLSSDLVIAGDLRPSALLEGGEYKAGTLSEAQHQWKLATYARKITLTRQAIINDDLSAMERIPEILGRGFRRLESDLVWALITGNATTSVDGLPLFAAGHNNTGTGPVGITGMNAGKKAMRKQADIAGNTVNLTPNYMVVPSDLEGTALQFLYPTGYSPTALSGNAGPNVYAGAVQLIVEPRLDGSATQWYLAATPGQVEGIVYGYLAGEEGPTIVTNEKRDPDGVELLARFDFGCAVKDFRAFYRSSGV